MKQTGFGLFEGFVDVAVSPEGAHAYVLHGSDEGSLACACSPGTRKAIAMISCNRSRPSFPVSMYA